MPIPRTRRVLIVEDNEVNFDLASAVLEPMGLDIDWARDGEEGLDRALTHQCDLLILDLQIPRISGRDLLRRLRQDPRTVSLPILVLTADAMQGTGQAVLGDGANAYLTKPFDLGVFRGIVAELLA